MPCIPKYLVNDFLARLKSGEMDPQKLIEMGDKGRHAYFASFLGDANAKWVNTEFERKLLLKNQQQGIINWAKKVAGLKPEVAKDLLSRVEKMDKVLQPETEEAFLGDLAEQRLGVSVTIEEAGKIADLARVAAEKKALIITDMPNGSKERLDYGTAYVGFQEYIKELKREANKLTPKEFLTSPGAIIDTVASITKSLLASLDNSFFGRQGLVSLITNPITWMKDFTKSWGDISKELRGIDAILPIKADIYSRKNALNGMYKKIGLDIGIESEEAYPSALPEKIPLLGILFKASESAYNGAALRLRADLADRYIQEFTELGVDVTDKETGLGTLINAMTGRGKVTLTPGQHRAINVLVFSIKYAKSNFDVLTAHLLDPKMDPKVKKLAANNLLRIITTLGSILGIAKMLDPDSVELDPRSSNFGKILVGTNHEISINISAGMGSLITLAARITPSIHNGKWGMWSKNSKGRYTNAWDNKYGAATPVDFVVNYLTGKAAPISRLFLDLWKGEVYGGGKPTLKGEAITTTTPIGIQNLYQLSKSSAGADPVLYAILSALDLLGVGVNTKIRR